MRASCLVWALVLTTPALPAGPTPPRADGEQARVLENLRAADIRLHGIFFRLVTRNAPLCAEVAPATGMILHARSLYADGFAETADAIFGFRSEVAVEGVVPASPAAAAGVRQNDSLLRIGDSPITGAKGQEAIALARDAIERYGRDGAVDLSVARGDARQSLRVGTVAACDARIELKLSDDREAGTDGATLQVTSALMNQLPSDDMLAAVIAHELAHIVLMHPQRLTEAGVARGILSAFGRNRRLLRRTEDEADRLSIYLMLNAGYDPLAAAEFWRTVGREIGPGIFSAGTHAGWKERAAMIEAEVARATAMSARPIIPPLIATRGEPLD